MKLPASEDPTKIAVLMSACENLAEKLGVAVSRERMPGLGGLCRFKGQWRLYLNPDLEPEEQLEICVRALAGFDLSDHYLPPALREEIERVGGKALSD